MRDFEMKIKIGDIEFYAKGSYQDVIEQFDKFNKEILPNATIILRPI